MQQYKRMIKRPLFLEGQEYYYWVSGKKKSPAILVIPGFTGIHNDLLDMTRLLRKKYFVIIPDLPGWGASPKLKTTATIQNYAKYLEKLIDHVDISSVILIGHCLGTAVAIEYATQHLNKVEKLLLLNIPYNDGALARKCMAGLAKMAAMSPEKIRPVFYFWRARVLSMILIMFILQVKSWRKRLRAGLHTWKVQPQQDEEVVEANWFSLMYFDFKKAKRIKKPIHIIHGERDYIVGADVVKKFHEFLPQSTFDIIQGGGHNLQFEKPELVERTILRYL